MAGNITRQRPIPIHPWIVSTEDADVDTFLQSLTNPDFTVIADAKGLWAMECGDSDEGTVAGSAGAAYIISAEAHKRVKAHRY